MDTNYAVNSIERHRRGTSRDPGRSPKRPNLSRSTRPPGPSDLARAPRMLISSSRQMPPIDAMRNARQFAPRVKQTPPKCQPTAAEDLRPHQGSSDPISAMLIIVHLPAHSGSGTDMPLGSSSSRGMPDIPRPRRMLRQVRAPSAGSRPAPCIPFERLFCIFSLGPQLRFPANVTPARRQPPANDWKPVIKSP